MDTKEKTIFVGDISGDVTQELLEEIFIQMGPINNIKILDRPTGRIAFVEFADDKSVLFCCRMMQGLKLFGKEIRITPRHGSENDREWCKYIRTQREQQRNNNYDQKSYGRSDERNDYRRSRDERQVTDEVRRQLSREGYGYEGLGSFLLPPPPPPLVATPDRYSRFSSGERSHSSPHGRQNSTSHSFQRGNGQSGWSRSSSRSHGQSHRRSGSPQHGHGQSRRSRSPHYKNSNSSRNSTSFTGTTGNLPSVFLKR